MPTEATHVYGYMVRSGTVRYRCGTESGSVDVTVGRPPRGAANGVAAWCELAAARGGLRATLRLRNGLGLPVEILAASLETNLAVAPSTRVFANGWQSDSASGLVRISDGLPFPRFASAADRALGDYGFVRYGRGRVHSWSYAWFGAGAAFSWFGALDETLAFARFDFAAPARGPGPAGLAIHADCDGLVLPPAPRTKGTPQETVRLLDVYLAMGDETACVDGYFALRRRIRGENPDPRVRPRSPGRPGVAWIARPEPRGADPPATVGAAEIEAAAEPFLLLDEPLDYLFVGRRDVCALAPRAGAGEGSGANGRPAVLRAAFDAVRRSGALPGVSLSPFACEERSDLYRERKEFLALDVRGHPLRIGADRPGERVLYVMDFYDAAYRRHLETLFRPLVAEGGAGLVRLERLHAAALLGGAGRGRTRAQATQDALRLLQDLCRGIPAVAAGVPLGAAFETVEYAAVGPEPAAARRSPFARLAARGLRERPVADAVVRTAAGRRHLDGRAFRSDPGPFSLRRAQDPGEDADRRRHAQACALFGGLLSTADPVRAYSSPERERFRDALRRCGSRRFEKRVLSVADEEGGALRVVIELRGERSEEAIPPPTRR